MTKRMKYIWAYGIAVGTVLLSGLELIRQDERNRKVNMEESLINSPSKDNSYQTVRHYNFEQGSFNNYSDEEIRMLREKQSYKSNGSYIYTPGRHVPSREQEIENYLEDNPEIIEEIYDKYRD